MKVLQEVGLGLISELLFCESSKDIQDVLKNAETALAKSTVPRDEREMLWVKIKRNLTSLLQDEGLVPDATTQIDRILKRMK